MDADTTSERAGLPNGVYSDGELLWRARPGATSSFEDNVAARALFLDLHHDEFWNPWRMDEQAEALALSEQVMAEWERAEPGFKQKTTRQLDADMARWRREQEKERIRREAERQANLCRYDERRHRARIALLEHQCALAHAVDEAARYRGCERAPAMEPTRRAKEVAELDESIARRKAAIDELIPVVGDPEDVPDRLGRLPRDRRYITHSVYRERRIAEVRDLRAKITELTPKTKQVGDRAERSKLRAERDVCQQRLDTLLAVTRLEPEAMCADCATPAAHHGYVSPPYDSPCPAWPDWGARLAEVRRMFEEMAARNDKMTAAPLAPKPEPIAVIPSGLPIAEVLERLTELQRLHPQAEVRRGRANRWELWPAPTARNNQKDEAP